MNAMNKEEHGMNRRGFLLLSASAICTSILYHNMAGAASEKTGSEFIESSCQKDEKIKKRVLITYASRCGSSGGVAEAIGQVLCGMGASVDVRLVGSVNDLSPYHGVIVGSAIRMGKWLPEAVGFVKDNQDMLGLLPVAYFVVCLTMKDDTAGNRSTVMAYLAPVRKEAPKIQPTAVGLFPGAVDFSKLSFVNKMILKAKGISEGDYRDWPTVKSWASAVGPTLPVT
ncbi:MAG: flavodoxin domain-containing protein [Proteobacteria bacterium]|nr:flavodoxin domain-containing protein [Pseudomonadota bacterium]